MMARNKNFRVKISAVDKRETNIKTLLNQD